jgi:hypothetical protein
VVAEWRMLAAPSERVGELRLRLRSDRVAGMLVSFDGDR